MVVGHGRTMPRSYRGSSYPSFSWRCLLGARGFSRTGALTAISRKGTVRNGPTLPGWSFNNVTNRAPLRWRTIAANRQYSPRAGGRFSLQRQRAVPRCDVPLHGPLVLFTWPTPPGPAVHPPSPQRRGSVGPTLASWWDGYYPSRRGAAPPVGPCPVALVPMWGHSGSSLSGGMFRITMPCRSDGRL